jgi:hypothetical protein
MTLVMRLAVALIALALLAVAWRAPTAAERQAIERTVRANPSASGWTVLRFRSVRVSTVDRDYASADTDVFLKGEKGDGPSWLLRKGVHGWRVIFVGTDMPPCKVAPAAVRRDLFNTAICD